MSIRRLVLSRKCAAHTPFAWIKCCSCRRSPDEPTFHDGNFDHSVSRQVLPVGWRKHRVRSLSKSVESQVVWEIRQTSAQLSRMDPGPHNGVGPGGVSKIPSGPKEG